MKQAVRAVVVKDGALLVMHRNKFGHEYYTLVGGGVNQHETPEQAVHREIHEETGLDVSIIRQVFVEEAGAPYGTQLVYLCEYQSGDIALQADSEEAQINKLGQNLYTPMWLPLEQLPSVEFLSPRLQRHVLAGLRDGWPQQPVHITHD